MGEMLFYKLKGNCIKDAVPFDFEKLKIQRIRKFTYNNAMQ